jgi:hypothetical protein
MKRTCGLGLRGCRLLLTALAECRRQFFSVLFTGFGRAGGAKSSGRV